MPVFFFRLFYPAPVVAHYHLGGFMAHLLGDK
jgi:hypothetical protein